MQRAKKRNTSYTLEMLKALILGLIISLVLVLVMGFVIQMLNLDATNIINQIIKGVSVLIAALVSFRLPKNGWIRGLLFGILYIGLTFVVFSLLDNGNFKLGLPLLNDVALGGITGLVSGIIAVNIRKHN